MVMPSFFRYLKSKKYLSYFFILLFISISSLFFFLSKQKLSFQEITDQLFYEDIVTDTLSLHYTLAYPSHYSVNSYPLTLPEYDKKILNQSKKINSS